ncbi:hypothetical protein [Sphingomonas aerolata]|uniref:hypothetical protein n=1 Tax=Sphingomonas aerolata TaxID=185951 RepID=UPI00141B95DE|nr:hypothetical protein [Sphingomonas aerolata]NII60212.1 hypothetical protein [Sphingomonas aerolata]
MQLVDSMQPDDIAMAADVLIEQLDLRAGDPDIEDDTEDHDIVDEPHDCDGDELDGNASEDEFMIHAVTGEMPGCPIADPGGTDLSWRFDHHEDDEEDGACLRAPHRDRIRRTRCMEKRAGRHVTGYRLPAAAPLAGVQRA